MQESDIKDQERLARFFKRLLTESSSQQIDRIIIRTGTERLSCQLVKASSVVRTIDLASAWFVPIESWLQRRAVVANSTSSSQLSDKEWKINVITSLEENIVTSVVSRSEDLKGCKLLQIADIKFQAWTHYARSLGFSERAIECLAASRLREQGLIALSSPRLDQLTALGAIVAACIPQAIWPESTEKIGELADHLRNNLLIVSLQSDDLISTITILRKHNIESKSPDSSLLLCLAAVDRICGACARESAIDTSYIASLPIELRPAKDSKHLIGRGCSICKHSGYEGQILIESAVTISEQDWSKQLDELCVDLYKTGMRSLLEDGITKIREGRSSFESIFKATRVASDFYIKQLSSKSTVRNEEIAPIAADFSLDPNSAQISSAASNDQPLFGFGKLVKVRTKPQLLVVEDDADQREILEMVLRAANYDVRFAENGQRALEGLKQERPDLIITDLMMPELDGTQLVGRLKNDPNYRSIPVMVLTVLADADNEYRLLDLGVEDYCDKSVQRKVLLKRIERILDRRPGL